MARPSLPAARVFRVTFRLRPGKDDDLIALFDSIPAGERPRTLGALLREGSPATSSKPASGNKDETLTQDAANFLD